MTKSQILAQLKKLMGRDYNHAYQSGRTIEQLRATLGRYGFYAMPDNAPEVKALVRANCDVSFIKQHLNRVRP